MCTRGGKRGKREGEEEGAEGTRTTEEVVEERGGAALGEEVARELRDPGDDVDRGRGLDPAVLVRVRGRGERREHELRDVQELRVRYGESGKGKVGVRDAVRARDRLGGARGGGNAPWRRAGGRSSTPRRRWPRWRPS